MSAPEPVNDRRTRPGFRRRARSRARAATHRGDERGGAISLWVVLMVPVSAFAAVVALAGPPAPRRGVQRAGRGRRPRRCSRWPGATATTRLRANCGRSRPSARPEPTKRTPIWPCPGGLHRLARSDSCRLPRRIPMMSTPSRPALRSDQGVQNQTFSSSCSRPMQPADCCRLQDAVELKDRSSTRLVDAAGGLGKGLRRCCPTRWCATWGTLGVDVGSLRGFYSDSLTESPMTGSCSDPQHTTQARVHWGE